MKMKKSFYALAILAASATTAQADEYGCKVLMCLANPQGPMAVQDCVPPIQQMIREQAQKPRKAFPQCPESGGKAYADLTRKPYDDCPSGMAALERGEVVLRSIPSGTWSPTPVTTSHYTVGVSKETAESVVRFTGIGAGTDSDGGATKICVSGHLGIVTLVYQDPAYENEERSFTLPAYRNYAFVSPSSKPNMINVFIDGKLFNHVRL